jgi:hypothetical protein
MQIFVVPREYEAMEHLLRSEMRDRIGMDREEYPSEPTEVIIPWQTNPKWLVQMIAPWNGEKVEDAKQWLPLEVASIPAWPNYNNPWRNDFQLFLGRGERLMR